MIYVEVISVDVGVIGVALRVEVADAVTDDFMDCVLKIGDVLVYFVDVLWILWGVWVWVWVWILFWARQFD